MKNFVTAVPTTVFGLLLGISSWTMAQSGPSGDYSAQVTDPQSAVWDLTAIPGLTTGYSFSVEDEFAEVDLAFDRELQHWGTGKLSGSGGTEVSLDLYDEMGHEFVVFPATYKTSGSVAGNRGICRIRMNTTVTGMGTLDGVNRRLTGSENLAVTVDNTSLTSSGSSRTKASASGIGGINGVDTWSGESLDMGPATWTLRLLGLATSGKKVTGAAEVVLHSGAVHEFAVKGNYNAKNGLSKLVLTGQGAAKGSNLVVTIGAGDFVMAVKGKMFGQMVNAVFTN